MTTEELLIHELAERAGISVRTIRYYIEEGLLPQPSYQGKYSYYSTAFLDRLELIRRLKDSYLPLKEIRFIMNSLSDREVQKKLKEEPLPSPRFSTQAREPQQLTKPGAKALDYIDRVMEDQSKYRTKGTIDHAQQTHFQEPVIVHKPAVNQVAPAPAAPQAEEWQRIPLAPGVELHLRRPLDPATHSLVQQVIVYARRVFRGNPKY